MENQPGRRRLSSDEREALRRKRYESRASSTYKQFIKDLHAKGFASEAEAELAASSVLCALEQRLTNAVVFKLESQLPDKLKDLLVRCERHDDLLPRDIGRAELLELIQHTLPGGELEALKAARAVFETVAEHVSTGEVQKLMHQLPGDLRALWPKWVQAGDERAEPPPASSRRATAASEPSKEIIDRVFELPLLTRLGILRTIAPRIVAALDEHERADFLRDLAAGVERVLRGEATVDVRQEARAHRQRRRQP
jgi:uncharacterized protein (DUF2267 family)